jgi:hypothetical protein
VTRLHYNVTHVLKTLLGLEDLVSYAGVARSHSETPSFFDFDLGGKQNVKLSLVLCLLPFRIAHENPGRVGAIGGSVCNKQRHCQDVLSAVCCARMCCVMETIGRYFKNLPAAPTFVQTRTSSKKKGAGGPDLLRAPHVVITSVQY